MKNIIKILFLLLLVNTAQAQVFTSLGANITSKKYKLTGNVEDNTSTKISVLSSDGQLNWILKANLIGDALAAMPPITLQNVLDNNAIASGYISIRDISGNLGVDIVDEGYIDVYNLTNETEIYPLGIDITRMSFGYAKFRASNITSTITLEAPNRVNALIDTETIATQEWAAANISSGGVASITSGTNVTVDNTIPTAPVINADDVNITYTPSLRQINSSTGTGAVLPLVDLTDAGLMSVADKTKLNGLVDANLLHTTGAETKAGVLTLTNTPKINTGKIDLFDVTGGSYGNILLDDSTYYFNDVLGNPTFTCSPNAFGFYKTATDYFNFDINAVTGSKLITWRNLAGTVALTSDITGTNSGTNTGDNAVNTLYSGLVSNATHTGDVTGATALTIGNNVVSNTKLATMPANTFKANNTGSTANATDITVAQAKTLLAIANTDVSGLGTLSTQSGTFTAIPQANVTNLVTDLAGKQATLVSATNIKTVNGNSLLGSGDVVISGGATNLTYTPSATNGIVVSDTGTDATIALGNGTNAGLSLNDYTTAEKSKLTGIASGATANSSDATLLDRANHTGTQLASTISDFNTQVATTATLKTNNLSDVSNITTARNNILPSKTGNANKYLRVNAGETDYEVVTLAGGGDATIAGGLNQFTGTTTATFTETTTPTTPTATNLKVYAKEIGGRAVFSTIDEFGEINHLQSSLVFNKLSAITPGATTVPTVIGRTMTSLTTISHPVPASTNLKTSTNRITYTSAATAGALTGTRVAVNECLRGNAAKIGGFYIVDRISLTTLQAGQRGFFGISTSGSTAPTNIDPLASTTAGVIGLAFNLNTGNWQLVRNTAGVAPTVIDLGASFPINNTDIIELVLYTPANNANVYYRVKNLNTDVESTGTLSTNLPLNTAPMGRTNWMTNNATAAAVAFDLLIMSCETQY
jgi:hypothetical protein